MPSPENDCGHQSWEDGCPVCEAEAAEALRLIGYTVIPPASTDA